MENRRLLIATFFSALVLIVWNQFMVSQQPPVSQDPTDRPPAEAPATPDGEPGTPSAGTPSAGTPSAGETSPPREEAAMPEATEPGAMPVAETVSIDFGADVVAADLESRSVLETDKLRLEISNRGAQLVSLRLKAQLNQAGESLDLVRRRGADPYPFALVVGARASHPLNKALFVATEEKDAAGHAVLRFRHKSELGAAEKVFRMTEEGLLAVEVTVPGEDDWGLVLGPGIRQLEADEAENRFIARQASWKRGSESETLAPDKPEEDVFIPAAGLDWAALEDNFFLSAVIPREGLAEVLIRPVLQRKELVDADKYRFLPIDSEIDSDKVFHELMMLLEAGGQRMELLTFYGSKEYSDLAALPYGLEETVRWGFFGIFARPLYLALEWIYHNMVANYGWAIVLVTCLIKLLFFPLTYKSQDSMAKMQELNPKVQAIRNKYRTKLKDKQGRPNVEAQRQQNEEIMALYKKAGVNPVSGCFPVLLQMPVFFAFFRLLSTAVELRGAGWLLWIQDLSAKDPYYVLPLVMGATSVLMQKMMPQSPEPMQRRMMQLMPIMFTVFALAFPSGLVLYWVTNNLLTMVQQAVMNQVKKRKRAIAVEA